MYCIHLITQYMWYTRGSEGHCRFVCFCTMTLPGSWQRQSIFKWLHKLCFTVTVAACVGKQVGQWLTSYKFTALPRTNFPLHSCLSILTQASEIWALNPSVIIKRCLEALIYWVFSLTKSRQYKHYSNTFRFHRPLKISACPIGAENHVQSRCSVVPRSLYTKYTQSAGLSVGFCWAEFSSSSGFSSDAS